jgi:hypothetical protein
LNFLHVKPFKPSLKGQEGMLFGLGLHGLKGTLVNFLFQAWHE